MKRSPIKRGTSRLARRPAAPGARSTLHTKSTGQARRDTSIDRAIAEAKNRDGHRCQAAEHGLLVHVECRGPLDGQHVIPRGVRRDLAAEVENIVSLCRGHHDYVGDHPDEARALGLHGRSGDWPPPIVLHNPHRY